ncbi:AI-2E family transporter [Marivita sp. GX14005]|uniref:AI-2E family transporter n=1 Tax=Marivita sp. GX14005 TaxID=2942276 RepID=UPI002018806E|nr:AI-2E family transporter [Marivita sp. GX14005]MCL3880744.1 AI-2E family transporter [Marivita sp. GX14005]
MLRSRTRLAQVQLVCLGLLAFVAAVYTLRLTESIAAPVVLGLVIGIVASPGVRMLERIGIPRAASASIGLFMVAAFTTVLLISLGPVVMDLIGQLPRIEDDVRFWLIRMSRTIRGLEFVRREIEETLSTGGDGAVDEAVPTLIDALWLAPNFAAQLLTFAGTFFFFSLTQREIYAYFENYRNALRKADRAVSHYFVTVTTINAVLGLAVFAVMTAIGMASPVLWGLAAFLLNFILYLGPVLMIVSLLIAGLIQFDGAYSILPPLAYFSLNMIEAQFVTPQLVGQRLRLNPLVVFLAIVFGLWLWGPVGGIVSLPVVVWVSVFVSQTGALEDEPQVDPSPTQA